MEFCRRPSTLRLINACVLCLMAGLATPTLAWSADGAAPRQRPTAVRSAEPPLSRLIIKLKDSAADFTGRANVRTAMVQISDLGNRAQPRVAASGAVRLGYLRSMDGNVHVASTDRALSRAELQAVVQQLQQDPKVAYAEIDERVYPQFVPNDPAYTTYQWQLQNAATLNEGAANLPGAWDYSSGNGVVVAVLDTGYRPHQDLVGNILTNNGVTLISNAAIANNGGSTRGPGAADPGDWVSQSDITNDPADFSNCPISDSSWHGTHVSGLIAATTNNGIGVAGIAFSSRLLQVRVLGKCGGYISDVVDGINWSVGQSVGGVSNNTVPARVINLSMSANSSCSATFQAAINNARAAGAVVVAATGNDTANNLREPANCSGVIAVTAHTRRGDLAQYANIGTGTTLSAPGGGSGENLLSNDGAGIYSTLNTGTTGPVADSYNTLAGTSMAAAEVSGVVAQLLSIRPSLTPDQVAIVLTSSARPFPGNSYCHGDSRCGAGMLDAAAAVSWLQAHPTIALPAPPSSGGGGGGGALAWADLMVLAVGAGIAAWAGRKRMGPQ